MVTKSVKKISIITVGSTGDIVPFIALALKLKEYGHKVQLITCLTFKDKIESYNIDCFPLSVDIMEIIKNINTDKLYTGSLINQMKTVLELGKDTLEQSLIESWEACKETEVIIFHPLVFGGIHIAEKLDIPAFIATTVPGISPTKEFPSPICNNKNLRIFNKLTYYLPQIAVQPYYGIINKWRKEVLGLKHHPFYKSILKVNGKMLPVLNCCSPHIVKPPADWDKNSIMTGYWFLKQEDSWTPSEELINFLNAGEAPLYIGFGSMTGTNPAKVTTCVLEALNNTKKRAIISTGWGGINNIKVPDSVYITDSIPHDWLFPKVSAVIHHGGAGTTSAGLKAGKPSIIIPFLLDQHYWGEKIYKLGLGPEPLPQLKLTASKLTQAIESIYENSTYQEKATTIAGKINSENGTQVALEFINSYLQ